jgi:hypothetical protein
MLTLAKAALALFWILALANLLHPFAGPYMNAIAALLLVIHVLEMGVCSARRNRCWRACTCCCSGCCTCAASAPEIQPEPRCACAGLC